MDEMLTFADIVQRMESGHAILQQRTPYFNRHLLEGTTIAFSHYCEWFEVNVHDAVALSPEDVVRLLQPSPGTRLENSDPDDDGNLRWFGGARVGDHHVRAWYNPQAFRAAFLRSIRSVAALFTSRNLKLETRN